MSLSAVVFVVILIIAVSYAMECPEFIERGLVNRTLIIENLTSIRNKVEKGGFDNPLPKEPLKKLVYDLELERHAKEYIENCQSAIDEDKHKGLGYSKISIYQAKKENRYPWHFVISTKFASRRNNYNFSDPLNIQNEYYTNQFLQMINAETNRVGCDYGLYFNKTGIERRYYTHRFICFFVPAYKPHTLPYQILKHDEPVNPDLNEKTTSIPKPSTVLIDSDPADSVTISNYPSVSNSNYHPAKVVIKCEL